MKVEVKLELNEELGVYHLPTENMKIREYPLAHLVSNN